MEKARWRPLPGASSSGPSRLDGRRHGNGLFVLLSKPHPGRRSLRGVVGCDHRPSEACGKRSRSRGGRQDARGSRRRRDDARRNSRRERSRVTVQFNAKKGDQPKKSASPGPPLPRHSTSYVAFFSKSRCVASALRYEAVNRGLLRECARRLARGHSNKKCRPEAPSRSIRMFDLLLAKCNRPRVHSSLSDREARLLKIRVGERANGHGN